MLKFILLALALLPWLPAPAAAAWDPALGTYYEFSPYYGTAPCLALTDARTAQLTGFRIRENNGPLGLLLLTLTMPPEPDPDRGTGSRGPRDDHGSESDLLFYFNSLGGDASGFEWQFYLGGFTFGPALTCKSGIKFGIVGGTYRNQQDQEGKWTSFSVAIPLRLSGSLWAQRIKVLTDLDLNLLSVFRLGGEQGVAQAADLTFGPTPLRCELDFAPHPRFLLYAGLAAVVAEETKFGFGTGYFAGAGLRF